METSTEFQTMASLFYKYKQIWVPDTFVVPKTSIRNANIHFVVIYIYIYIYIMFKMTIQNFKKFNLRLTAIKIPQCDSIFVAYLYQSANVLLFIYDINWLIVSVVTLSNSFFEGPPKSWLFILQALWKCLMLYMHTLYSRTLLNIDFIRDCVKIKSQS